MKKKVKLVCMLSVLMVLQAQAVYLGKNSNAQALPQAAVIPPLVSVLDATDVNGKTESLPFRHFNIGPFSWTFQHDCAATLIGVDVKTNHSYLLTSAHCVTDPTATPGVGLIDGPMNKRVVVGNSWCTLSRAHVQQCETKLAKDDPKVYTLDGIFVNAKWFKGGGFLSSDFAVLSVVGVLKLNGVPIQPMQVAYHDKDWHQLQRLYLAGWGTTDATQLAAYHAHAERMPMAYDRPNIAALQSLPTAQCQALLKTASDWLFSSEYSVPELDMERQICTGDAGSVTLPMKDSTICYGDSGSPLFAASSPDGWGMKTQFTLVGNVSGSLALCSPALCQASEEHTERDPLRLTQNCYDNTQNATRTSVPGVYGFPGAILCAPGALSVSEWLAAPNTWKQTSTASLSAKSLLMLTEGGLQPHCV